MKEMIARIGSLKIIPIMTVERASDALNAAKALVEGGLPCAEVTFRTAAAEEAIRAIRKIEGILLGAGTILKPEQVDLAAKAGAQFIVTPGFNPQVVRRCLDRGMPVFPGVATPTEIETALSFGLEVVKYFPMEAFGGLKTLKAVSAPYPMMRFIPTGGISAANLKSYLEFPKVLACGGSWLATKELISAGRYDEIARLVREAVQIAQALKA